MNTPTPSSRDPFDASSHPDVLKAAQAGQSTIDYLIIGSGAGGGPMAARLAAAGKRVLLIESGQDPRWQALTDTAGKPTLNPDGSPKLVESETNQIPAYYAAASEDPHYSAEYSVRHYADNDRQKKDSKYNPAHDKDGTTGGIFYPRASAIGGCTSHHAMIIAAPNDRDWDHIADITNDESWRASNMRGYFAKMERCLYRDTYRVFLRNIPLVGLFYRLWEKISRAVNPAGFLYNGGHGKDGWQPTSQLAPQLLETVAKHDKSLINVVFRSALSVLHQDNILLSWLKQLKQRMGLISALDPNDYITRSRTPESAYLIPTGIEQGLDKDRDGRGLQGRRVGVREFLERTAKDHPDNLLIVPRFQVDELIFSGSGDDLRVTGVRGQKGSFLFPTSPNFDPSKDGTAGEFYVRAGGEVILSGGSYSTPQLMMLSGIGPRAELEKHNIPVRVELPGVGQNLQDRYEVTVISSLDKPFETLNTVSFEPGDPKDKARLEWLEKKSGLYVTNGGVVAILRRSPAADGPEPDLFIFGAPAAFRGYYWGWSKELLRPRMGDQIDQRNLWSWIILKAYTRNNCGTVTLRSRSNKDSPVINFHSFGEGSSDPAVIEGAEKDLEALADAVSFVRKINQQNPKQFTVEIQPGPARHDDSAELKDWIKDETWGHHACGTCRIGSDAHTMDTSKLLDKGAVLDSKFRVHGVKGLRVVDASVFPKIPGYFIVTPIFMVSEKAADTILQDATEVVYPLAVEAAESKVIKARREKAKWVDLAAKSLPEDVVKKREEDKITAAAAPARDQTVGLAISGGGIRSATFGLGVLQSLASKNRLRQIDVLSTVSGGGFTGSFLGRLFTRSVVSSAADPAGRVQDLLKDSRSGPLWWLRTQANYIFATGSGDYWSNFGIVLRNLLSLHLVMIGVLFVGFGILAGLPTIIPLARVLSLIPSIPLPVSNAVLSPWWWLPLVVLGLAALPAALGYWLAPKSGYLRPHSPWPLLAWMVLLLGAGATLIFEGGRPLAIVGLIVLPLAWLWQESARWSPPAGSAGPETIGKVVRNRLSSSLSEALKLSAILFLIVLVDTVGATAATFDLSISGAIHALGAVSPLLLGLIGSRLQLNPAQVASDLKSGSFSFTSLARNFAPVLIGFYAIWISMSAHQIFCQGSTSGWLAVLIAAGFSLTLGRAFDFLNLSSLHNQYKARLNRTFQGATNPSRLHPTPADDARDIGVPHAGDDMPYAQYHPEANGGPLHLINVCINRSIDFASNRDIRDRRGQSMAISPIGVTVGSDYFSTWAPVTKLTRWQRFRRWIQGAPPINPNEPTALAALPDPANPNAFHPLANIHSPTAAVEPLSLGAWTAISGAAFSTGSGRDTRLSTSLFNGLLNIRLGYWWDSGVRYEEHPGCYPENIWRRLKRLPVTLFRMQSMILAEWAGRYHGSSRWFWYLSDGGHFEVTAAYELIRRRLEFMIVLDGGEDPNYQWQDFALLTQLVRQDFRAEIRWQTPEEALKEAPEWLWQWLKPSALGDQGKIARLGGAQNAALAKVIYYDRNDHPVQTSWLLVVKPAIIAGLSLDLVAQASLDKDFPNDPTLNQAYNDIQWESYRALGEQSGDKIFR